jgi:hypothetical protein
MNKGSSGNLFTFGHQNDCFVNRARTWMNSRSAALLVSPESDRIKHVVSRDKAMVIKHSSHWSLFSISGFHQSREEIATA